MKRLRLLHGVMKRTRAYHIIGIFVVFVFVCAGVILAVEPDITNYGDALWYTHVCMFTIGFGDIVPATALARVISVILTIYATLVIAVVTGVIVATYNAIAAKQLERSSEYLLDNIQRIDQMSKEELKEFSETLKKLSE